MDNRSEVREFLTTRRAKISPQQAGVPLYGTRRRVPGLRREEVAQLAGVSTDYYTRLEKGNLRGASEDVLEAIARALHLDEAERAHLFDLARAARGARPARRRPQLQHIRRGLQQMLDAMTNAAAFISNGRLDIMATNALARGLYADAFDTDGRPANLARFCFLDPRSQEFYPNWADAADITVAILRTEAGKDPYNRSLTDLVGELATRSDAFRTRWAAHDVRLHQAGAKVFQHPVVGELSLDYETIPLPPDPGLSLTVYTAQPASATAERLALLASWVASPTVAQELAVGDEDGRTRT